ncbi:MAG: DMT family transporter [Thermostichales cyanobacterium DRC_bins_46]
MQRAYFYVGLAIVGWSTVATAFKMALRTLDSWQLLAGSSVASSLVLLMTLVGQRKLSLFLAQTPAQLRLSALQGLLNPCGYYVLLFLAYARLPAQAALALNYVWPLALAVLAVPVLGEKWRWRTLVALGISLVGVLLIASGGQWQTLQIEDPLGVALALSSALVWASYWLTNVRDQRDSVVKLATGFLFGSSYALLLVPLFSQVRMPTWAEVGWLSYVGTMEMGLTFVWWLRGLELAPDRGAIANWVYVAPFLSLALIAGVLGERIHLSSLLGLGLIIGSILWQAQQKSANSRASNNLS